MTPHKTNKQINLESLDDRIVPAGMIDLSTDGAVGTTAGGVLTQVDARPTGTGFIHSFVRLQANGSGSSAEQGYNTNARPLQYDENSSPLFTRALTFGKVPYVTKTVNGQTGTYREFLLDINQKSSAPYLSLDDVKVFVANRPDLNNYDPATGSLSGPNGAVATRVWEFGAGDWAKLNYRLNSGSGAGDMTLCVPETAFAGVTLDQYVYVYSKFGSNGGFQANSGFEEWAVSTSGNFGIPDGGGASDGGGGQAGSGTSSLSGFVYLDANDNGMKDDTEFGIKGVTVHISGETDTGKSYEFYVTTDDHGYYKFSNLESGTYMIWEEQPEGYMQGMNSVGTIAGIASGSLSETQDDYIIGIYLGPNQEGIDYNFGELQAGSA